MAVIDGAGTQRLVDDCIKAGFTAYLCNIQNIM